MFEKVNPSHPDKLCDRIAGAIVDLAYSLQDDPRIAVEVLLGHGKCFIIAETTVTLDDEDVTAIVYRITGKNPEIDFIQVPQDKHLSDNQADGFRCGDNGIFKGVPVTDDEEFLSCLAKEIYEQFPYDGKYIVDGLRIIICQSNASLDVTTYDIRLKRPNKEPVIDIGAMHSLEHIIATTLRNDPVWKDEVIYWGPMGCLTGFYLILKGNRTPQEIYDIVLKGFKSVADAKDVPGATKECCGHYLMHNLEMAKWYAKEFVEYLEKNKNNKDIYEYPRTERLVTEEGQHFFDS